ncbi:periplasmic binding family protein [Ochrobactrum quorumnocens]|uniref:Periplasmic binding family protein n=3 Tax=Ochrobactrum quorumnocens TaxID=271865 RepID=A0A248UGS2_9HYPH|nr:ABC transporter substrate-binding protein [[Ochrobactrum] quorumnocens]ASV85822.1 periplasmic binding family protein [[Ochrobactrum] quorumnocens]
MLCLPTMAQENSTVIRIGIAAPLSGGFAPLGNQLVDGARVAATAKNAELVVADDRCDAEGGKTAAETFIKDNVQIATGFLCSEALEAALPLLNRRNIPVITSGVSDLTLTEKRSSTPPPVFRLTTGLDKETRATGSFLGSLWRSQPFAVIDDGTIEGRERASHVLASLREQQLQPVFTDTYRPGLENQNALVARLRRAGATHVYVGGERDDIAAIGASATTLKYPLVIAGGSVLNAAPGTQPLSADTLMIAPLKPQDLSTAKTAVDAINQAGKLAEAYSINGFATIELAEAAIRQATDQKQPLIDILRDNSFETSLGTLNFDGNGMRTDNPNRLQRYDGTQFISAD